MQAKRHGIFFLHVVIVIAAAGCGELEGPVAAAVRMQSSTEGPTHPGTRHSTHPTQGETMYSSPRD